MDFSEWDIQGLSNGAMNQHFVKEKHLHFIRDDSRGIEHSRNSI